MQYHFIVNWSEENGWVIDWEITIAKFKGNNVYIPNIDEWVFPGKDTETGDKEKQLIDLLEKALDNIK